MVLLCTSKESHCFGLAVVSLRGARLLASIRQHCSKCAGKLALAASCIYNESFDEAAFRGRARNFCAVYAHDVCLTRSGIGAIYQ